ncbi:FAD-binding oxidoreductase [Sneathiella aquimaris]|uniref:FAD-binding oxidoreductase n=1 Tax=Sneathiella aquimaris TaxID=2599305 RepID=UPI00146D0A32|nr:FAD-linked oxidase C-terminal domain-containing protein [Sneathiella aquimaris]
MSLHPEKLETVKSKLQKILGDRCTTAHSVLHQHGTDESWHIPCPPDIVCFAHSTEEVSRIVKICADNQVPIIPFGAGTSLEGHINAVEGGVCIDLGQMNEILKVNTEDLDCTVQPGVRRKQLNEYLRDTGLFFPIDPGADASIGGMASTRASGTNAVRYGTMRENILNLTVVLPDGKIIKTGGRAKKSAAGYDLTKLYIGSEGTLGIITEITLRLYGIPEAIAAATVSFEDIENAVQSVILTIQTGVPIARIELLDDVQVDAINKYSGLDLPVQPLLFLEFHGSEQGVKEQSEMVRSICDDFGARDFTWTVQAEDRTKLWQARHDAAYAAKALRPNASIWATDVCVPISRLADCIMQTKADLDESDLIAPIVGHVGDGNFHLAFVLDKDRPEEFEEAERINGRLIQRALEMEGTCTGEHGVGLGKRKYLKQELGDAVDVMRALKMALDPQNIMNPGKII